MDEQLSALLKQQLRDVHLPEEVSWWPLAYGWWILLALTTLAIAALIYYFLRKRKRNAYRYGAIKELNIAFAQWQQQNDAGAYLQSANAILKRSVLHFTAGHDVASQSGQAWLNTLAGSAKGPLSVELTDALNSQVYRANPQADIKLVHQEICIWLKTHQAKVPLERQTGNPNAKAKGSELNEPRLDRSEAGSA